MGGIRRPSGCISHVVQVAARKQIPEILLRARFAVQIGGASFSWCVVWSLRELGKRISWPKLGQLIGLPSNYERCGTRTKAVYKKWIEPWISSNAVREGTGGEEPGKSGESGGPGGLRYGTVPWLGGSGSSRAVGQVSDSRIITREPTHVMLQQPIELWGTSSQHVVLDEIVSRLSFGPLNQGIINLVPGSRRISTALPTEKYK
ncbi:hypothetical protein BSKO_11373 [Bryopsis sp. KO-2023]|nr:hypothetical protein BSKO_11373 [Bryopsis sp. KO-2023]